jgi:hypothetical protein
MNPAGDVAEHLTPPLVDTERFRSALETRGANVRQQGVNRARVRARRPTDRAADLADLAEVAPGKPALPGADRSLGHSFNNAVEDKASALHEF